MMKEQRVFFRRINKAWLLVLALVLLLPNFLPFHLTEMASPKKIAEAFDPASVQHYRTVVNIRNAVDKAANERNISVRSLAYAEILNDVVQQRFYHGYSHYALNENWMAAVAGYLVWNHLSAIVIPDDLLKYPMAACSQQSLLMMQLLRNKGIPVRKVGFAHHFALEAKFDNQWYYFDTDMEPDFDSYTRASYEHLQKQGAIEKIYRSRLSAQQIPWVFANLQYEENYAGAPNATLFHIVTKALSRFLWILPFGLWLNSFLVYRRRPIRNLLQLSK